MTANDSINPTNQPNLTNQPTYTIWPITNLKVNPLWPATVTDTPEVKETRQHILRTKIVQTPLAILSNGVILDGRIRFEAAKLAGLDMLPVIVHAELDNDPAGQIRFMLRSNGLRRIMSEFARVLLALELKKELAKLAKVNQKNGGKNGAAAKHGVASKGPAVQKKINARDDAAQEIGQAGSFLAHAEALYKRFVAGEAPVWRLYEASIGPLPVLKLEVAYALARGGVTVEDQQALVDQVLALDVDEQRRAARLGAEELLVKYGKSKKNKATKKKAQGQSTPETTHSPAGEVSSGGLAEIGCVPVPAQKPALSGEPLGLDLSMAEVARLAGLLGSALSLLTNKSKFELVVKALTALQAKHDERAQTIELTTAALVKLLETAKQDLVGGLSQAA